MGQKRAKRYRDETEKVQEQINRPEATKQEGIQAVRSAMQSATEQPQDWWGWELKTKAEADPVKREQIYREGLRHFSQSAELTTNFALFMTDIRKDYDEAERLYRRALELNPNNAHIIGNFALFMTDIRMDHDEAERLYRRALELDPNDANITGNFAGFLLSCGRWSEAWEYANAAANFEQTKKSQTFAEIEFYRALLAVQHSQTPDSYLKSLKSLLRSGFVRGSWSFDAHLAAVAAYLNHDQRIFYRKLADAILDDAKLADLELLPEWQAIKTLPDI